MNNTIGIIGRIQFKIYERMNTPLKRFLLWVLCKFNIQSVKIMFLERYGFVRDEFSSFNTITNAGKAQMALLTTTVDTPFTYLGVGSGNTAPAATQTALVSEISTNGLGRHVATLSRITTAQTNDTAKLNYAWTASGSQTVEEIGIFNAPSVGTMLGRALTGSKAMVNGETLTMIYTVQFQ